MKRGLDEDDGLFGPPAEVVRPPSLHPHISALVAKMLELVVTALEGCASDGDWTRRVSELRQMRNYLPHLEEKVGEADSRLAYELAVLHFEEKKLKTAFFKQPKLLAQARALRVQILNELKALFIVVQ